MPLDLDKWPIFSLLTYDFQLSVRQACVFGSSGNEAIIITKDDDIFSLGSNCSGCLGLGQCHYVALAGQWGTMFSPRGLISSRPLLLFYLLSGDAFGSLEPKKIELLCRKNIVSLAFGSGPHVLAITACKY